MSCLILVVDDEPVIREVLAEVLAEAGHRVHLARDGLEALDAAARDPPDVVVTDVRMPRLDGIELVRRLRARGQEVPVVVVSAHYAGMDVPGVRFLVKPFDIDAITAAVARSLDGGGAGADRRAGADAVVPPSDPLLRRPAPDDDR